MTCSCRYTSALSTMQSVQSMKDTVLHLALTVTISTTLRAHGFHMPVSRRRRCFAEHSGRTYREQPFARHARTATADSTMSHTPTRGLSCQHYAGYHVHIIVTAWLQQQPKKPLQTMNYTLACNAVCERRPSACLVSRWHGFITHHANVCPMRKPAQACVHSPRAQRHVIATAKCL